jgi:hypothetical protein
MAIYTYMSETTEVSYSTFVKKSLTLNDLVSVSILENRIQFLIQS